MAIDPFAQFAVRDPTLDPLKRRGPLPTLPPGGTTPFVPPINPPTTPPPLTGAAAWNAATPQNAYGDSAEQGRLQGKTGWDQFKVDTAGMNFDDPAVARKYLQDLNNDYQRTTAGGWDARLLQSNWYDQAGERNPLLSLDANGNPNATGGSLDPNGNRTVTSTTDPTTGKTWDGSPGKTLPTLPPGSPTPFTPPFAGTDQPGYTLNDARPFPPQAPDPFAMFQQQQQQQQQPPGVDPNNPLINPWRPPVSGQVTSFAGRR